MKILKEISDAIHFFIRDYFYDGTILISQIFFKFILLIIVFFIIDFINKKLIDFILKLISRRHHKPLIKAVLDSEVHHSVIRLMSLTFADLVIEEIFWRHPKSYQVLDFIIVALSIVISIRIVNRLLKSVEKYLIITNDHYRATAFKAIYDTIKLIGYIMVAILMVSKLLGVTMAGVLGYIGAFTALLILVFRDTILGLVTGLHVSISKNLKVGDWVGIKKYDIEGTIQEINLLTTKILNFDKTVSTIPTYDLLSTEIKNIQVMYEGKERRIKRSIYFNIKSFRFIDDEFYERLKDINLISGYLENRYSEIKKERESLRNKQRVINGKQLTNIGVFRNYTLNYLKNSPNISQTDMLLVRQMEITPQGMPLEIYCFANKTGMADYEQIQADIFDHILTAAAEFDLEVMQMTLK
ncbi:MAG: mechanosensitive ion channel [Flavobacteriaceae bacterium]|nr:mechanosensitive ion channel [Flavobacteriaceae bacterium]